MKKKQSEQKIEIYFNFIGNYELPQAELSEEEKQKLVNVNIKMYKSDNIKMYNYSKLT